MRRILSIDGGGVRGILPCSALVALERQTGKLTRELFDMVAGTSTGALLAAAVAAGIPASRMLSIYTDRSKDIFTPGGPVSTPLMVARGFRYESENLYRVLREEFGAAVNWKVNDSPIRILVTAVGANGHPWYFVRDNPRNAATTGKCELIECATASACAPTYFSPCYVHPGKILVGWCFDGGVGVTGNPVYQACVEAFDYDDFHPEDTQVVSLGTGYFPSLNANPPRGLLNTISWTVDSLIDSAEGQQTELVNRHWPGIMTRLNFELPHAIDMADTGSIPQLVQLGREAASGMDWAQILKT